jgi:hypothetical protein
MQEKVEKNFNGGVFVLRHCELAKQSIVKCVMDCHASLCYARNDGNVKMTLLTTLQDGSC